MMVASLAAILFLMKYMNQSPGSRSQIAGFFLGGSPDLEHVEMCPTRVKKIEVVGGTSVTQDTGGNWIRESDGKREELASLPVERWLSENCTITPQNPQKSTTFTQGQHGGESSAQAAASTQGVESAPGSAPTPASHNNGTGQSARPFANWSYVSGPALTLFQIQGDTFEWQGRVFQAPLLTEALRELNNLPAAAVVRPSAPGKSSPGAVGRPAR